ncbi:hypothetical protein GX48_06870 [Paracoccidioides brasiliensis]|nr:hypothetical protein GX48_06870 [Paracoccidioides brasiliensis]
MHKSHDHPDDVMMFIFRRNLSLVSLFLSIYSQFAVDFSTSLSWKGRADGPFGNINHPPSNGSAWWVRKIRTWEDFIEDNPLDDEKEDMDFYFWISWLAPYSWQEEALVDFNDRIPLSRVAVSMYEDECRISDEARTRLLENDTGAALPRTLSPPGRYRLSTSSRRPLELFFLLSLMSFFDRQEIPFGGSLSRLREGGQAEDLSRKLVEIRSRSVEALELLKSVTELENQDVYRMAEYDGARLGLRFIYCIYVK